MQNENSAPYLKGLNLEARLSSCSLNVLTDLSLLIDLLGDLLPLCLVVLYPGGGAIMNSPRGEAVLKVVLLSLAEFLTDSSFKKFLTCHELKELLKLLRFKVLSKASSFSES